MFKKTVKREVKGVPGTRHLYFADGTTLAVHADGQYKSLSVRSALQCARIGDKITFMSAAENGRHFQYDVIS